MKTPQEEAEEMAIDCAKSLFIDGHLQSGHVYRTREIIQETIPLPELIAVARAANKALNHYAVVSDEEVELSDALLALKATGKVEL